MEQDQEWPIRFAVEIGRRVEHFRKKANDGKGVTVQAVADRCKEIGLPLDRSVIAKLEKGLRQSVSVAEVLVLAEALRVPPVSLIFPVNEPGADVEVLPGRHVDAWSAAKWLSGVGLPPWETDDQDDSYFDRLQFVDGIETRRDHDTWLLSWITAKGERDHAEDAGDAELLDVAQRLIKVTERGLKTTRRAMRTDGAVSLPSLPRELRHLDQDLPPTRKAP
jgi:hypothetical protein